MATFMKQACKRALYLALCCAPLAACNGSSNRAGDTSDAGTTQPLPTVPPTYTSEAPGTSNGTFSDATGKGGAVPAAAPGGQATTTSNGSAAAPVVPGGRVADVQEADVYRIQDNKLYLLNTYRGFLVYDISNPKSPVRLSHLPVYGYPVEMFVENNTAYALLSDSLYLSKVNGKLQFQRRNTSQIVTIDISDPAHPKLLQALDLAGQLREGVSRKIGNTIYVVSYQPSGYWYYGWGPRNGQQPNEQAWVYSFDVSTPSNLRQVGQLKVFEGGSTSSYDPTTGENHSRYSNGVTLSATSNAIMVVQNWYTYDYVPGTATSTGTGGTGGGTVYACGSYKNDQQSVVSVVDVSDPSGAIRVAATFTTEGALTDQFKQTYVYDASANTGTYLGIFARNVWSGSGCNYAQQTQNTLESWDITGNGSATLLSSVDFGKPNETVRGSYFDVDRKVAFAITAQSMDPMYALSFADRNNLGILSSIDGLSGDMDLFRPVDNGQYLLAVGRDTGAACSSYTGGNADAGVKSAGSGISISLIDVRDLAKIRLVQRKCLDIANAGWVSSNVTWNLDQAHKMIGLASDGTTSVLTVPVSYSVIDDSNPNWYWYRYETAVGIVSWDLANYDDTLPPEQQNVITTHGHFVHPNGQVNRSVIYTQDGASQREMLNISDTYLSFANLQNLDNPTLDSVVEVASADQAVFHFGNYMVEQVLLPSSDYSQSAYEFRVKQAGSDLDDSPTLASFTVGEVQLVLRHGNQLVLLRAVQSQTSDDAGMANPSYTTQALVYDLSDPTSPKPAGTVNLPADVSPYGSYYRYYCGGLGYSCGYYFGYAQSMLSVDEGIAFLVQNGSYVPNTVTLADGGTQTQYSWVAKQNLAFLDLRNPAQPTVSETALALPGAGTNGVSSASLVADDASAIGFYITYRVQIGSSVDPTTQIPLYQYANYAQRWQRTGGTWVTDPAINIPGTLVRSWAGSDGLRRFLTRDDQYTSRQTNGYWQWLDTVTLNLLRVQDIGGAPGALLLDSAAFSDMTPKALSYDGDHIYMVLSDTPYYYGYYLNGPVATVGAPVAVNGGVATGVATSGAGGSGTTDTAGATADTSDRLVVLDTSQDSLTTVYDQPTELSNLDLMGVEQNKLFVNLQGDGILVVDVSNPAAPQGVCFYRTLGWASGIEFAGTTAYVPASNYGVYRLDLTAPGNL